MTHDAFDTVRSRFPELDIAWRKRRYERALLAAATLREPVDRFLGEVRVSHSDPAIRANRLRLARDVADLVRSVAHLERLGEGRPS